MTLTTAMKRTLWTEPVIWEDSRRETPWATPSLLLTNLSLLSLSPSTSFTCEDYITLPMVPFSLCVRKDTCSFIKVRKKLGGFVY